MREIEIRLAGELVDAALKCQAALFQPDSYDLVITDNKLPKVSGFELIGKVHASSMLLLGTVKNFLCAAIPTAMFFLCLPTASNGQNGLQPPTGFRIISSDSAPRPNAAQAHSVLLHAVALSVHGKCCSSQDSVTFTTLEQGDNIEPGAVIRTSNASEMDLFFQRNGTTVRLLSATEIRLDKIGMTIKDGRLAEHVSLNLRVGSIVTVVRSTVSGNSLEILNAAGRAVVEGSGIGNYVITANGTNISATGSILPLKLMGDHGITIIAAGQQFTTQDGRLLPLSLSSCAKDLSHLGQLMASTAEPAVGTPSPKP
jgi:hypothetical protein